MSPPPLVYERYAKLVSRGAPDSVDFLNGQWQVARRLPAPGARKKESDRPTHALPP